MSVNIYQLNIETNRLDEVKTFLFNWLRDTHQKEPVVSSNQDSHFEFFQHEIPMLFALGVLHENWITVLHDSYDFLVDLANRLSARFDCHVIHSLGQSTVETYYLSVHYGGVMIRKIYSGEDSLGIEQEGKPFPFEKSPLGKNIGSPEEDFYVFGYEDMGEFCSHINIDILRGLFEIDGAWTVLKFEKEKEKEKRKSLFSFFK